MMGKKSMVIHNIHNIHNEIVEKAPQSVDRKKQFSFSGGCAIMDGRER